jgi:hypothetical protein
MGVREELTKFLECALQDIAGLRVLHKAKIIISRGCDLRAAGKLLTTLN